MVSVHQFKYVKTEYWIRSYLQNFRSVNWFAYSCHKKKHFWQFYAEITRFYYCFSAEAIQSYYYMLLIPVGVVGNVLSFLVKKTISRSFNLIFKWLLFTQPKMMRSFQLQVMMQSHNRQLSFSLYLSALAVNDTIALLFSEYGFSFVQIFRVWIFLFKRFELIFWYLTHKNVYPK